jgi:hypothetical protein
MVVGCGGFTVLCPGALFVFRPFLFAAATSEAVSLDAFGSEAPPNATTSSGGGGGAAAAAAADGSEQFDGVLSLLPQHHQYICGLKWAGGAGRGSALFTASYDGSLRRLDVERGVSGE